MLGWSSFFHLWILELNVNAFLEFLKKIPQELLLNKNGEIVTQVVQIPTIQMDFVEAKIFSMTMADVFKDTKWNPNYKSKLSDTKSMRIMGKIIMQQINVLGPELPRNVNVN